MRKERYKFPIDVEDDGGAWYNSEGEGIDERRIETRLAVWMCLILLRELMIKWGRITWPRFSEDVQLKKRINDKEKT